MLFRGRQQRTIPFGEVDISYLASELLVGTSYYGPKSDKGPKKRGVAMPPSVFEPTAYKRAKFSRTNKRVFENACAADIARASSTMVVAAATELPPSAADWLGAFWELAPINAHQPKLRFRSWPTD